MIKRIKEISIGGASALFIAAAALGTLTLPTSAAHAQWVGVQVGPFGVGIGAPSYSYAPYGYSYYHYYYPYGYRWGYPY